VNVGDDDGAHGRTLNTGGRAGGEPRG
jgi:hypothetical protein